MGNRSLQEVWHAHTKQVVAENIEEDTGWDVGLG